MCIQEEGSYEQQKQHGNPSWEVSFMPQIKQI